MTNTDGDYGDGDGGGVSAAEDDCPSRRGRRRAKGSLASSCCSFRLE